MSIVRRHIVPAAFSLVVAAFLAPPACSSTTISTERHVDVSSSGGLADGGGPDSGIAGQGTGGSSATGGLTATGGFMATGGSAGTGGILGFPEGKTDAGLQKCASCLLRLSTTQSNAFHVTAGSPLKVTAGLEGHTVFGLGTAGAGRLVFSGDGNVVFREGECPLWQWLGATGSAFPRVLCIGAKFPCAGETNPGAGDVNGLHAYPARLDYGGLTLPPAYDGNPDALRADYDVVTYFGVLDYATGTWRANPADEGTLDAFVRVEGGGLYLVSEYYGGGATDAQVTSLNALARPWSIEFEQLSLAWGETTAEATLACLPKDPREGELR